MVLCTWIMRPHILCPCVSLWMYFSICVSLIDGRIKTTSLCGIPNNYIANFCVKKLDGTGSQRHDENYICGDTYYNQNGSLCVSWLRGTMVRPRIYFRIGPANTGGSTSSAMAALKV